MWPFPSGTCGTLQVGASAPRLDSAPINNNKIQSIIDVDTVQLLDYYSDPTIGSRAYVS
eukprot:m.210140 g.210140  ORF g.210140 m.210140 type:complete len:59 (-) comp33064_c0_seq2:149-325(-)